MAERPAPEVGSVSSRKLLIHSLASLIDQALLSGLNFALGLVLIRLATKESYGVYSQLYVAGIFASTVIEALITGPLTTIAPGRSPDERARLATLLLRFQWQLSIGLALAFGAGSAFVADLTGIDAHPLLLGIAFAVYLFANAQREYHRSISFIEARPRRVLHTDIAYALAAAIGVGILLLVGYLTVPAIFLVMGLANIVGMWRSTDHGYARQAHEPASFRAAVAEVMQRGRWALPGALVAWATNYSYLYIAAAMLGVAAAADLNASRLLLMPISLSVLAWSRVARPMVSRLSAARDWKHLDHLAWASVAGIEIVTVLYVVVLWLALPWLQAHVLGVKYHGLEPMVLAWGGYFAINAARWIGSSWLTSNDQYRLLLVSGVACLIVMLISASVFIPLYGAWGAILALIIVEVFDLLLIWAVFLPMLRRKNT
ncbi:lipopolysaccharide biosynthesis protein [Herbaspirillum sp. RV1423]|uniref:lipopolysaccharide biosynthesis protein n=1 Tax=Herbaspirillum sp. RV1423 TaxID=1443993 RepID=UPI001E53B987|nr:hypothetical protein [Herbaspirillum sp. RV1423]